MLKQEKVTFKDLKSVPDASCNSDKLYLEMGRQIREALKAELWDN